MSDSRGFRCSATDAVVLAVGGLVTWLLWPTAGTLALLIPVVLGHFFLFCNVFRIRRGAELLWTALFAINFTVWLLAGEFDWWSVLAVQAPLTLVILVHEIRHPAYHGVFSRPRA